MKTFNLSLYQGQTYQRTFTIENFDLDITKIYFTIKENTDDKNFVLQKKLNDGIYLMDKENNNYTFVLEFKPEDTECLKTNFNYGYDISIKSKSIKLPVLTGNFRVDPVYTRKADER